MAVDWRNAMKVVVGYSVPVFVAVDTAARTIDWVNVFDEGAQLSLGRATDGRTITDRSGREIGDQATREEAVQIIESAAWPAWEFGR